ncbi:MAG TPA: ABC transporter permease [Thermodesulfovibrionales bacterium]|nr:ABC transporter permease [Thermodesulfovibrionales bacterium]
MIRTALAFIKKDILIMLSYRFNFVIQIVGILIVVTIIYTLGSLVDSVDIPFLKPYGGSYFGFLMIGIAFSDYAGISINSFSGNIRDGQLTGTLEIILTSPTRLFTFLFSSSLWSYIFTTFRLFLYFLVSIFVFKLDIGKINIPAAFVIFVLSMLTFIAIGIISASLVLVFKQGDSALRRIGSVSMIVSGVLFPTEYLPSLLQNISLYLPFTYTYRGLRLSILQGHSLMLLQGDIAALTGFAIVLMVISSIAFSYAVKKAKIKGSLAQY